MAGDYKVLEADSIRSLEKQVAEWIVKDWDVQGGVFVSVWVDADGDTNLRFYQAMILEA